MTIAQESRAAEPGATLDYVPGVRGHAALVTGTGADGTEAIAVWALGAFGSPTGAWVLPLASLDKDHLLAVMNMVRGRCLIGWTEEAAVAALSRVEAVLPAELVARLHAASLAIPALIAETREQRARCSAAVTAHGAVSGTKTAPLKWAGDLPDDAAELAPRHVPAASPVAAHALAMAGALSRAVDLWQGTEETRYRRTCLRSLGEKQPLPPGWLRRLRDAESGLEG